MCLFIRYLAQKQESLKSLENAPSVEERREELRQKGFDIAKRRALVVGKLQVRGSIFSEMYSHSSESSTN